MHAVIGAMYQCSIYLQDCMDKFVSHSTRTLKHNRQAVQVMKAPVHRAPSMYAEYMPTVSALSSDISLIVNLENCINMANL